jgi:hypothetical protein
MKNTNYDFFNNLNTRFNVDDLKNQYASSNLVPHIIVDNFLPNNIFIDLCNEIKNFPRDKWIVKNLKNSGIRKESRDFTETPLIQHVMTQFTAGSFVNWLSSITGCTQIIPDVHHLGAGLSSAPAGAYLGLHVDFNWNDTLKLNRKFNLIFYVNEAWEDDWNGELEFWDKTKTQCFFTIKPIPNRLIIWEYEQDLAHGFTKPLACPSEVERQNLMKIYYTSNSTPSSLPRKSEFF